MKIEHTGPVAQTPRPAPAQTPSRSFSALLDEEADKSSAVGFQARGMFGRIEAVAAPSPTLPRPSIVKEPPSGLDMHAAAPPSAETSAATMAQRSRVLQSWGGRQAEQAAPSRPASAHPTPPLPDNPGDAVTPPKPAAPEERTGQRLHGAAQNAPDRRTPTGLTHSPLRMLQSDQASVVSLALSAKDLSPDELAAFRQRAAQLIGSHGLTLDKLILNGEDRSETTMGLRGDESWR